MVGRQIAHPGPPVSSEVPVPGGGASIQLDLSVEAYKWVGSDRDRGSWATRQACGYLCGDLLAGLLAGGSDDS